MYDNLLKTILCDVINVQLDEVSWSQAFLPIRFGGIDIRRTAQLAPAAFLTSAAGCSDLIRLILPSHLQNVSYPAQESTLTSWQCGHDEPPPSSLAVHHQEGLDSPRIQATYFSLLDGFHDPCAQARLLAVATKELGAWLNALPISSISLRMDDEVIGIEVLVCASGFHCVFCLNANIAELRWITSTLMALAVVTAMAATHAMRPLTT